MSVGCLGPEVTTWARGNFWVTGVLSILAVGVAPAASLSSTPAAKGGFYCIRQTSTGQA